MLPSPPPAPPAAAEDEKRPSPPMKWNLLFPYAVFRVYGGMGRTWGMAIIGIHILISVLRIVFFDTEPEEAIFRGLVYLGIAAIVLIACLNIACYIAVKFDPPPQQQPVGAAAAAAVQLPPPPPEMDMC